MRILFYIIVVLTMIMIPMKRSDVGNLLPVEVVAVYKNNQGIRIWTDTGNTGIGANLEAAYKDMEKGAEGDLYLDTADYLILTGDALDVKDELGTYLKKRTKVCRSNEDIDVSVVAPYLAMHKPEINLNELQKDMQLQVLRQRDTGFVLE